ncbi:MAG: hypothetical protein AAF481_19150 [Acidobacteriota bacterium]
MRKLILLLALAAAVAVPLLAASAGNGDQAKSAEDYTREVKAERDAEWDLVDTAWMVDDGRTVTVMWDFTAPNPLAPVIEVPRAGDYWWYEGSAASLFGAAELTEEGVLLFAETDADRPNEDQNPTDTQDPDVIGILEVEDTNPPEEKKQKLVQLTYKWKRQGGGTAPPGPTVTIEPNNARIIAINRAPAGAYEKVTIKMTFGPPCPASVKAKFSRAPGGPAVVIGGASIVGVCADPIH